MTSMKAVALALAATAMAWSGAAKAQSLNLYCSVQIEWCQAIAVNFQRDTGIRVNMTQKGSGEMLAQIRAEAQNPRGDVWFGGTGDPHLAAAEENLTVENESKALADLSPGPSCNTRRRRSGRSASMPASSASASTPSCWRARTCRSPQAGRIF